MSLLYCPFLNAQVKVNPIVDNIRYWMEMVELGLVAPNPEIEIPVSRYKGTQIETPYSSASSPDVPLITLGVNTQTENTVFVNPTNNQYVLNSNNSIGGAVSPGTANALISVDGGANWSGSINAVGGHENKGDPAAVVDLNGNYYVGYIDTESANDPSKKKGQAISKSINGGTTWTDHVIKDGFNSSANLSLPILDKNHLWVDNSPISPYVGNLYCAWTELTGSNVNPNNGEIDFSTSTDGGLTWTAAPSGISCAANPGGLSSCSPNVTNTSTHQGVNIQTGPNGEVYAVWSIYDGSSQVWPHPPENALGFAKSLDGGQTFAPASRIENNGNFSLVNGTNINGIRWSPPSPNPNNLTNPIGKHMRTNSFPCMAVDIRQFGYGSGFIYVVWANEGDPNNNNIGTDISIYMTRSTNGGATWEDPVRVNQDPLGNKQFFPWITCDPTTGELSVIFYDDRDVGPAELETWVAVSRDQGNTWKDFRVSDVAFTPTPIPGSAKHYMGDYIGISARDGKVYPVWTDNRVDPNNNNAQIHLAYTSPFCLSCQPHLYLPTAVNNTIDEQEAYYTIEAVNEISNNSDAVYLAGEEVLMGDGFSVHGNSQYRAYIDVCNGTFIKSAPYDPNQPIAQPKKKKPISYFEPKEEHIELSISPNPTSGIFTVVLDDESILETFDLKIYSMSGGLVYQNKFNGEGHNQFQVDISEFRTGVYFIELKNSINSSVYSGKIVKD